jgi:SPP1 family predicted phage head-tail adaptor
MACCKKKTASLLKKRVIAQSIGLGSKDALGGFNNRAWADSFTAWAEIKPITGREMLENLRIDESVTFKITFRYKAAKTLLDAADRNKWRIKFGARYFNIRAVINKDEANELVEVYCSESTVGEDGNAKP